jgi:hypothetical protein
MDLEPLTRQELIEGYRHPYRRWIPVALDYERVPRKVAVAAALCAAALAADRIDGPDPLVVVMMLCIALGVVAYGAWVAFRAALLIHARTQDWQADEDELAAVLRARPHADDADPLIAHDEYAVAVGDHGDLVTWRFLPLRANENPPRRMRLVAGTPRYAAEPHLRAPYDPVDAARAAEQLADAQQAAAALERDAIERAAHGIEAALTARELEIESRGTGAALRSITGQAE